MARQANMEYTHTTFNVGAAIKAYDVIWNNPSRLPDVIVHLRDFQAMMAFFGTIGSYVAGSFEEVLFQAGLCSSGSIKGLISGKHYNRCWLMHKAFSEALERLFLQRFLPDTPSLIKNFAQDLPDVAEVSPLLQHEVVMEYAIAYQEQKRKCLDGDFGKTPQYWCRYLTLVDRQQQLHYSINTNDFSLRLSMWQQSLPLCFAMNVLNQQLIST